MKIGIHCNQFDGRGTGKVPYDYGLGLQNVLGHEVIYITSKNSPNSCLSRIKNAFETVLYDTKPIHHQTPNEQAITNRLIDDIASRERLDFIHFIKSGENDGISPKNCKTGIQCVFHMTQPHGNVYAGVSKYIAEKYKQINYIPHIIKKFDKTKNLRAELNIPESAFVIGRHGGPGHFNIPFVKQAIIDVLEHRPDLYFIFLSTDTFIEHKRIIYIPWVEQNSDVYNFIHACDCMIHAREDGETFGLAIAEFSACNKPVITWSGTLDNYKHERYDTAHLDMLGDRAIIYNGYQDILDTLFSIDKKFISEYDWDKYSINFSERNVMLKYEETFLK